MPTLSLPFYRNGEPFQPRITLQELEEHEEAEQAALPKRATTMLKLRAKFLERVISRDADGPVELKATASEIHDAIHAVWWTQALGEQQIPLARAGAASASAKPAESVSRSSSPESPIPSVSVASRPA